jgi:serine phosphatase RsbU (regulator of sigma subunit)/anti-sigma regulatory factor (Ser/Thr protein kinase)
MKNKDLTILVADDDLPNRFVLQAILDKQGFNVLQADDGLQAVEIFEREKPDLVLMDIKMPNMDGYEATRIIKDKSGESFVPVIFLTATSDDEGLAKCVESGGDDFLTKPYNHVLLKARIEALIRIRDLYNTVHSQRNELANHQKRLDHERELASRLFNNIVETGSLGLANINSLLSPMSLFSGDILLVAPKPSGGLHVLLGDFTGHGLAAATGALPVSSVFYGMTAKGFSVAEIIAEINEKLIAILPSNMFLAACMIEMNPNSHTLSIWNGGIPPVLIYSELEQGLSKEIKPRHLPLGIVGGNRFSRRIDVVEMHEGDRVYIHSDGVTETTNPNGSMYGLDRLVEIFEKNKIPGKLFEEIVENLKDFQAGGEQQDDVAMIELQYQQTLLESMVDLKTSLSSTVGHPSSSWSLSMELGADIIRYFDPLPLLIQSVNDLQGFRGQGQKLYTVFSELFSNALEHGILELNSDLKKTADGFARYYTERQSKLGELSKGKIKIDIKHSPKGKGGELIICFQDSGHGFDYRSARLALEDNVSHSGRGIQLLESLCERVEYSDKGNVVKAIYRW